MRAPSTAVAVLFVVSAVAAVGPKATMVTASEQLDQYATVRLVSDLAQLTENRWQMSIYPSVANWISRTGTLARRLPS